jgi:hypothetical protein
MASGRRCRRGVVPSCRLISGNTRTWVNRESVDQTGSPAVRIDIGGEVNTAVSLAVENGRITRIYAMRNPHKLARLDGVAALTRT